MRPAANTTDSLPPREATDSDRHYGVKGLDHPIATFFIDEQF